MDELIKDILEYSQVWTKDEEFRRVDCSLVLSKAIFNLQVAIEESGAVVIHDNLPTIMADSALLKYHESPGAFSFASHQPPPKATKRATVS